MIFYKRHAKKINPRRQEAIILIFFVVAFFIYGMVNLRFYLFPQMDPLMEKGLDVSPATLAVIGGFFVYGMYAIATRRGFVGRLLGITVAVECSVAALWKLFFTTVGPQTVRLSGTIEGFVCFGIFFGLLLAVHRGESIFR
ncbi:MAG: hypothetical protein JXR76_30305 [Deltaproteobacteria bacterium]|nr:hypothetical protein [Deltaproteobacteria bacterium]